MMKRISIVLALLATAVLALSQQLILSGKVMDAKTKEPLSFATIRIKSGSGGTVSNADGEFSFITASQSKTDTLLITMMGYDSYQITLSEIQGINSMLVKLKPRPIELKEVTISGRKISAREVALKAFKNIKKNFQETPYMLKGFYREMQFENSNAVILTEVVLDVYDKGYSTTVPEKVDVKNIRTSRNYRHDCFKKTVIERYNLVASALGCNPLKYRNSGIVGNLRDKKFTMDSVVYLNGRRVYVISYFTYIHKYPLFERKNTMYVDAENYIIYKYGWEEYATKGKYSEKPWRLTKDSPYLSARRRISTMYEYGSYQGKMYLKYFDEKCYDDIVNASDESVVIEALSEVTWIITEIDIKNIDPNYKETLKRDQSLSAQAKPYDPAFWSNYEEVKLVPLRKKDIKDLEKEISLEEQFKDMK